MPSRVLPCIISTQGHPPAKEECSHNTNHAWHESGQYIQLHCVGKFIGQIEQRRQLIERTIDDNVGGVGGDSGRFPTARHFQSIQINCSKETS